MSKTVTSFTTQLIEYDTSVPFDTVQARLNVEVNRTGASDFMGQLSKVTEQKAFVSLIEREAEHGFLYFTNYPHHRILSFADGRPTPRNDLYVIGNPMLAQRIMDLNLASSYSVPLRLLLLEKPDGNGTWVHYHLPSSLLQLPAGQEKAELSAILERLDARFERLVQIITAQEPVAQN